MGSKYIYIYILKRKAERYLVLVGWALTLQNTLQHTLQHTATHCNTLRGRTSRDTSSSSDGHITTYCNTLSHTATYCNTLSHTATYCNTSDLTSDDCGLVTNASDLGLAGFLVAFLLFAATMGWLRLVGSLKS